MTKHAWMAVIPFLLCGCSSISKMMVSRTVDNAPTTQVAFGSQCNQVKMVCKTAQYREWVANDGRRSCTCKTQPD